MCYKCPEGMGGKVLRHILKCSAVNSDHASILSSEWILGNLLTMMNTSFCQCASLLFYYTLHWAQYDSNIFLGIKDTAIAVHFA